MSEDIHVVDTGMIDTDITFNPYTQEWYFVLDGTTYKSSNRAALGIMKQKALADRDAALMHRAAEEGWNLVKTHERQLRETQKQRERQAQQNTLIPDDPAALQRARELDEEWLEEKRQRQQREESPPHKGDPIHTLKSTVAWQNWEALVQAYRDGQHAGYEPEEIGEILYTMLQQQLGEQGYE